MTEAQGGISMAILSKSRLFNSPKLDSRIRSANTTGKEKWIGYFMGPMGAAILNFTIISYVNVFYTDVLDLTHSFPGAAAFLAMFPIFSKILDSITNLLMGQLIEKTRTRQGKARPWILISAPLMTLAIILLFLIPKEHSFLQLALIVLTYNLFFSFAYTVYNMSHTLMVPLSTNNVKQRDALSLFTNMGVNMLPGLVVSMVFPAILLPMMGVDYDKWLLTMTILAALALPFTLLEYFFTRERVTESATEALQQQSATFKEQLKACFSNGYWLIMIVFMLMFQIQQNIQTISLPYFCNWVLGKYNDGTTQMILSAVGKAPLGFGVFLLWPLVKKFGKRKVMIIGFFIAAAAELFCWYGAHSMPLMLVGSMMFAIGSLPTYVYSAVMADALDYIEYKEGIRADGLTASLFTIIMTISVGIGQGAFNAGLTGAGYEAPYLVAEGVYNVQNAAVQNHIIFCYILAPMIAFLVMAILMIFFRVEEKLPAIHEELTARRKAECEARGEVYLSLEERAALEEAEQEKQAEENRIAELKTFCEKKGLDFAVEEAKYQARLAEKKAKAEAKAAKRQKN